MPNNNSINPFLALIIGIIFGFAGYYIYLKEFSKTTTPATSTVNQIEGVYVFINSSPVNSTIQLGSYKTTNSFDTISFNQKTRNYIQKIKQQYPDVEAIVFNKRLDKCSVLKYQ